MSSIEGNLKELFRQNATKVKIYLRSTKTEGTNFDPIRKTGYTITYQNPSSIKAIVKDASPEKLIVKELGLVNLGAKELIVKDSDAELLKIAQKIEIDGEDYHTRCDAVGKNFVCWKRPCGFSRVILFKKSA